MRRFFCFLLCLFMLCGCSAATETVTPVLEGISFTAKINYYNEYYECDTELSENGSMRLTVRQPDDISGMRLIFDGKSITAEYMGLTYTPHTDALPVGGVAQLLYGIIGDMKSQSKIPAKDNRNCVFDGRIDEQAYSFCCSPSGLPLYIEIPDGSFRIEFSNVSITAK